MIGSGRHDSLKKLLDSLYKGHTHSGRGSAVMYSLQQEVKLAAGQFSSLHPVTKKVKGTKECSGRRQRSWTRHKGEQVGQKGNFRLLGHFSSFSASENSPVRRFSPVHPYQPLHTVLPHLLVSKAQLEWQRRMEGILPVAPLRTIPTRSE